MFVWGYKKIIKKTTRRFLPSPITNEDHLGIKQGSYNQQKGLLDLLFQNTSVTSSSRLKDRTFQFPNSLNQFGKTVQLERFPKFGKRDIHNPPPPKQKISFEKRKMVLPVDRIKIQILLWTLLWFLRYNV